MVEQQDQWKMQIIGGMAWTFIIATFAFIMYNYNFGSPLLWFLIISAFIIANIYTLYRSIDYYDTFNNPAIAIIGMIVSGICLLVIIAAVVILLFLLVKGSQK